MLIVLTIWRWTWQSGRLAAAAPLQHLLQQAAGWEQLLLSSGPHHQLFSGDLNRFCLFVTLELVLGWKIDWRTFWVLRWLTCGVPASTDQSLTPSSALADLVLPLGYNGDSRLGQGKVQNLLMTIILILMAQLLILVTDNMTALQVRGSLLLALNCLAMNTGLGIGLSALIRSLPIKVSHAQKFTPPIIAQCLVWAKPVTKVSIMKEWGNHNSLGKSLLTQMTRSYLIFVISFTQAGFSNSKFYT